MNLNRPDQRIRNRPEDKGRFTENFEEWKKQLIAYSEPIQKNKQQQQVKNTKSKNLINV